MDDLISKKELLKTIKISYGTLYRWKRMSLIPESWFIHRATATGQATFFPRERILSRVERIQSLKKELTSQQLQEIFSANIKSFRIPLSDFLYLDLVGKLTIKAFVTIFPDRTMLGFDDVFSMYVVDHLMQLSSIYLEDAKQVIKLLDCSLGKKPTKDFQLVILKKMGVPLTLLVKGNHDILFEEQTEIIASANLAEFEEALKDRLIS